MTDRGAVPPGLADLPDLASRPLGGSVVFASDDLFAEKENLIKPAPPVFDPAEFGNRGKVYDGWETRRRRGPGHDHAIVRLGVPGIVHGVVVDTSFFRGNYPPQVSVEALGADGYPSPDELAAMPWPPLVERVDAQGDRRNAYPVTSPFRWTHVRLSIYPDGGVARFRVHGTPLPDPRFLAGTVDLAAMEHGGRIVGCSDAFYASASHLIMPGRARSTGEGWENARRRGPGHDYVTVALAAAGHLRHVEIDTSRFIGNAPGQVRLLAADARGAGPVPDRGPSVPDGDTPMPDRDTPIPESSWREVLPLTRVQPDTRHHFLVDAVATHVRLDVIPDGGLARLKVYGEIVPDALARLRQRWQSALPPPGGAVERR
jgi:allantoicase